MVGTAVAGRLTDCRGEGGERRALGRAGGRRVSETKFLFKRARTKNQ